jgi:hypothetical protein
MNFRRGLFRLWIAFSFFWVAGTAWVLRHELTLDCGYFGVNEKPGDAFDFNMCFRHPATMEIAVAAWMLVPPCAVLALGVWILLGFLAKNSN